MLLSGGRYKKEVLLDGQSHLLLIREESGSPDTQARVCLRVCCSIVVVWDANLCSSAVLQLGGCSDPGLQPGERGQFPGALSALQPAKFAAYRRPHHRRRHSGLADEAARCSKWQGWIQSYEGPNQAGYCVLSGRNLLGQNHLVGPMTLLIVLETPPVWGGLNIHVLL